MFFLLFLAFLLKITESTVVFMYEMVFVMAVGLRGIEAGCRSSAYSPTAIANGPYMRKRRQGHLLLWSRPDDFLICALYVFKFVFANGFGID